MPKKSEVTILREYLKERHKEIYGIDYVTNSYAVEGRMLKNFINEYGLDVSMKFADACFQDYTPSSRYPGLNFSFMYSYQKARVLPRVLSEISKEQKRQQPIEQELSQQDFEEFI